MFNRDVYYALDPSSKAAVNQWIAWEFSVPSIPSLDVLVR